MGNTYKQGFFFCNPILTAKFLRCSHVLYGRYRIKIRFSSYSQLPQQTSRMICDQKSYVLHLLMLFTKLVFYLNMSESCHYPGRLMKTLVSNCENFLLFNWGRVLKFGAPSRYYKAVLYSKEIILSELNFLYI